LKQLSTLIDDLEQLTATLGAHPIFLLDTIHPIARKQDKTFQHLLSEIGSPRRSNIIGCITQK
jgi:hypothetical protein